MTWYAKGIDATIPPLNYEEASALGLVDARDTYVEAAAYPRSRDHNTVNEMRPQDTKSCGAPETNKPDEDSYGKRSLRLTRASTIVPRPVHWLWEGRLPLGSFSLLGGREGIGKSTVSYTIVADITRGKLPGRFEGIPKNVIVAATEDSWEHTIVPRLMAANADLDCVLRVEAVTSIGTETELTLPVDLVELERTVTSEDVALILLDPLLSRLDAQLDTHKDAEVRLALEPLVRLADRADAAVLGLIHVNKSTGTDPLNLIMASRAFAAVARAVLFAITSPDDEHVKMLGQAKNNLGRCDLPTLTYRIVSTQVADTDEGPVITGKVKWGDEDARSIRDVLESSSEGVETLTAAQEAAGWLLDYLTGVGGVVASARAKEDAALAGHSADAVKRARKKLNVTVESSGFPRTTLWRLPVGASPGETYPTAPTAPTVFAGLKMTGQLVQPVQSGGPPRGGTPLSEGQRGMCGVQERRETADASSVAHVRPPLAVPSPDLMHQSTSVRPDAS